MTDVVVTKNFGEVNDFVYSLKIYFVFASFCDCVPQCHKGCKKTVVKMLLLFQM